VQFVALNRIYKKLS